MKVGGTIKPWNGAIQKNGQDRALQSYQNMKTKIIYDTKIYLPCSRNFLKSGCAKGRPKTCRQYLPWASEAPSPGLFI